MKKIIIWILLAAILLGMLAYCGKSEDPTQPSAAPVETTEAPVGENNAAEVTAYLQAIYKDSGAKTSGNFERFGIVRIAGVPYEVVWTADVSEDLVKIIVNDDGTVTIDVNEKCTEDTVYVLTATVTDANGNTSTASWEYLLPGAASLEEMQAIVDQAYALEKGEAMAEEVTLTGVITSIDTVWSDQYQNITVTIAVEGREDKTIQCYRLKGEGAKDLIVGDTITVQGTLKNYNGTIEFDAGCTLVAVEKTGVPVEIPTDPHEIMEDVYALGNNESLPYGPVTLTGNICSIDTAYSEQYDNITVTIQIDYYTIKCYRLSGEGVEDLEMNDIITVKGYIKKYNGTREFEYPELLDVVKVGAYPQPKDQVEIVEAAYNLDPGWTLPYSPVTLTGTITKAGTWSDEYENVTVTFAVEGAENMPIKCYRMTYSDEATKEAIKSLAKGDVITVRGMLINYQDTKTGYCTIEFNYPELLSVTKAEIDSDSTAPLLTTKPKDGDIVIFVNLEAAMSKNASGSKMGTETAQVSGTTLAVTDDMARVKVSVDSNGYYTFTVGGKYLTSGKTGNALSLESTASDYSLWTLEDAGDGAWYIKSVNAVYNGNNQYIETYDGEFTTFSFKEANSKFYKIFMYVSPDDGTTDSGDSTTEDVYMTSAPKNGDKVVIVAPNYGKALSTVKAGYNNYYNAGVDVTVSNGKLTGYSDSEVWTVIVNDDGSYSFANGGQNIGLAASNSSMNLGAVNDDWNVNPLDDGLYNIVNIGRSGYAMEWYSSNNNWSTYYKNITTDDQFFMAFYLVEEADEPSPYMTSAPKNGDQVVIVAPAYNKALSTVKTGYNNYYNAGVDVTASNGKLTGYSDSEVWTVIVNADGSYSFANGGQNIGLAASNSSMNLGAVNDDWNVNPLDDGLYNIVNIGRSGYAMEWYSSNNNWSTYYKNITTDDQFFMAFYLVAEGSGSGDSGDSDSGNTDSATATITFDDTAKRTVGTTSQQVWVENGITVTNDKAASSSDVNTNYYNPVRFYKSSSVTIAYPGMTKIEVACNNTTYATALVNSISNATASASGTVVTIELSSAVDSFTISAMSAQVRVDSITVYAEPQVTINKISEALAAESGEFTVEGVVTLVDGKNIYVQDGTGAICVRMSSTPL